MRETAQMAARTTDPTLHSKIFCVQALSAGVPDWLWHPTPPTIIPRLKVPPGE